MIPFHVIELTWTCFVEWYKLLLVVGNRPLGVNVQCHLLRVVVGMSGDGSDERWFCIALGLADLKADLVGSCNQMVKN